MKDHIRLVTPPTIDEEIQAEVSQIMKECSEYVAKGQVECLVVLMGHPDGHWSHLVSTNKNFAEVIGHLDIVKQDLIRVHGED